MASTERDSQIEVFDHFSAELNHHCTEILHEVDSVQHENDLRDWFNNSEWRCDKKTDSLGPWNLLNKNELETVKERKEPENRVSDKVDYISSNIRTSKGLSGYLDPSLCGYLERNLWKGCVESVTFRYIPDNGKYRASKVAVQKFAIQKPGKRLGDKVLNSEQKQLQKEIQRELRREFEMMEKQGHWAKSQNEPSHQRSIENTVTVSTGGISSSSSPDHRAIEAVQSAQTSNAPKSPKPFKIPPPRSHSPVHLPPISVPLVSNSLVKTKLSESYGSKLDMLREVEGHGRTRSFSRSEERSKPKRSSSEPPPVPCKGMETAKMPTLEMTTASSTDNPRKPRATAVPHQRRVTRPSDAVRTLNNKAWSTKGATPSETDTAIQSTISDMVLLNSQGNSEPQSNTGSPRNKLRSKVRKGSDSDISTTAVSVGQLRYMSASGEVTVIPQFGEDSRTSSNANFYSMLEKENQRQVPQDEDPVSADVRSNKENLKGVIMTNKVITPMRLKPSTNRKLQKSQARTVHNANFLPSSSSRFTHDGFRAVQVGRVKAKEKRHQEAVVTPPVDLLPQIAGRKCDMAATSHRIV